MSNDPASCPRPNLLTAGVLALIALILTGVDGWFLLAKHYLAAAGFFGLFAVLPAWMAMNTAMEG